jgi:hypothetical protein
MPLTCTNQRSPGPNTSTSDINPTTPDEELN